MKGYKARLFPTKEQEAKLWKHINAARWTWNWCLAKQLENFKDGKPFISSYAMRDMWRNERPGWVKECAPNSLIESIFDLDNAYKRFFNIQKTGERFTKKKREWAKRKKKPLTLMDMNGHPQYKSKHSAKPSFGLQCDKISFYENGVVLTKIGRVKYRTDAQVMLGSQAMKKNLKNPRIAYIGDKWILSFSMEALQIKPQLTEKCIGIDLGLKTLATISCDGEIIKIKNINKTKRIMGLEKKLRRVQQKAARRVKGSKNQQKVNEQVGKQMAQLRNIRRDYTHKATRKVVDMLPRTICMEDLRVKNMMSNKHLAKHIQDACWGEFARQIQYKSAWQGTLYIEADRWEPSSKRCSECGNIKRDLRLSERIYKCNNCNLVIDRDDNAARNLERLAQSA